MAQQKQSRWFCLLLCIHARQQYITLWGKWKEISALKQRLAANFMLF